MHILLMFMAVIVIYFIVSTEENESTIQYTSTRVAHKPSMKIIKQQMVKIVKMRRDRLVSQSE